MKRLLFLAIPLLCILTGCFKDMDPFEGGDGVRTNLNGCKCVMLGTPGNVYISSTGDAGSYSVKSDVTMLRILDHHQFQLDFNIADTVAIVANQEYKIGTGNYKVTLVGPKEAPGEEIPLKGWVKFLQLNPSGRIVEARFELDGKDSSGQDYTLRHGFMRLYKQSPSGE